jgi:hypothetical protein
VSSLKLYQSNAPSNLSIFPCWGGLIVPSADFLQHNPDNASRHADRSGRFGGNTVRSRVDGVMTLESRVELVFTASVHGSLPHTALGIYRTRHSWPCLASTSSPIRDWYHKADQAQPTFFLLLWKREWAPISRHYSGL